MYSVCPVDGAEWPPLLLSGGAGLWDLEPGEGLRLAPGGHGQEPGLF